MRSWLPALRIARREARRARGRSALVLAMITLPVLGLAYVAVSYDMFKLSPTEGFTQDYGAADAALVWRNEGPLQQDWSGQAVAGETPPKATPPTEREVLALLPPGSRVLPVLTGSVPLRTKAGAGQLPAHGLNAADPMAAGLVTVRKGSAPAGPDQIAVTEEAGRRLGVGIGDTVEGTGEPGRSWRVTGLVEFPGDLGENVLFAPDAMPIPANDVTTPVWLADTPAPMAWPEVLRYNGRGVSVASRAVYQEPPSPEETPYPYDGQEISGAVRQFGVGGLIGGLGLLEVVLLAGPAFAVGARRRQRDLALVAANGGTPAQLRRIVLADGVVLGVAGAVLGIVLGIAVAFLSRPVAEVHLIHARAGGYRVFPLALAAIAGLAVLTGVLAALVPAFTAARFNLVAALTGRRGAVRSRKRWLVVGLALTGGGAALTAFGAARVDQGPVLAGLVVGELGLVLCTPALVGLIARLGGALPLAPRIALRDTARNRASAAPAISAVMAAVAGSVALGVYLVSSEAQQTAQYVPGMPTGYVSIDFDPSDPGLVRQAPQVEQAAVTALPGSRAYPLTSYGCPEGDKGQKGDAYCSMWATAPPANRCFINGLSGELTKAQQRQALRDWRCDQESGRHMYGNSPAANAVDDGTLIAAVLEPSAADLAAARRTLAAGGVVVSDRQLVADGKATIVIQDTRKPHSGQDVSEDDLPHLTVPAYRLASGRQFPGIIVPESLVERVGFAPRRAGLVLATAAMPSQAQEDATRAAVTRIAPQLADTMLIERGAPVNQDPIVYVLTAAAALITLGAAGIATGLAAADGRADLSTLAAVGASPRVRRALSLSQSGVIAGLGSVLGVMAGLGSAFAVLFAFNRSIVDRWPVTPEYPITAPWQTLLVVLVVPLVAMLGAGLLTRSRLPIERRLT